MCVQEDRIVTSDKTQWADLASRSLGAGVICANDELFADRENLIKPEDPVFQPHTFGNKGQVMDGWETRRRREPASDGQGDSAIVRLGCPGVVRRVVVDTSYFTGNYPPEVSVEACGAEGYLAPAELAAAQWMTLVPPSAVAGDARNEFDVAVEQRFTHVRLTIFPDGGDLVARTALQPDTRHRFAVPGGPVAGQVRLDVYPDGGMARLRVFGQPTAQARARLADRFLRLLPEAQLAAVLRAAALAPDEAARRAEARVGLADLPTAAHERFRIPSELSI
jgi:allantoicase